MKGVRLIVCGGVHYKHKEHVFRVLDDIHARKHIYLLIHGGGAGVGALTDEWAEDRGVRAEAHPIPRWMFDAFGSGCMPRRNAYMLTRRPDGVVSFPGSMGTANMVQQAQGARIPVKVIEPPEQPEPDPGKKLREPTIKGARVIVCGGRYYKNQDHVFSELNQMHVRQAIGLVIHGGAEGADDLADAWAVVTGIKTDPHPIPKWAWQIFGKCCGPKRNSYMLSDHCKPQAVIAFPGGAGTANIIAQAQDAGLPVTQVPRLDEVPE